MNARLFVAGADVRGRPLIARVEIAGDQLRVVEHVYTDPAVRSGREASAGVIAGLAQVGDCHGGQWLLATVERGRPRLIDPERLGVVALLGRRREWRGAAEVRSPFLEIRCDRPGVVVGVVEGGQTFMVSHAPGGAIDLLRIRPGLAIERWSLGEVGPRVELFAGECSLVLVAGERVATIDVGLLVPGGEPLTDPRDVELALDWRGLPASVVAVADGVWFIEREGDRWFAATRELEGMRRVARWPIERPQRWLSYAGSLWLANHATWTRIDANEGPCERGVVPSTISGPCSLELRDDAGPWLWWWSQESSALHRVNGRALAEGPIARWDLDASTTQLRRIEQLLVADISPPGEPASVHHEDELAELLALDPALGDRYARWFD